MSRTATAIPRHMSGPHTPKSCVDGRYYDEPDGKGNEVEYNEDLDTFVIVNEAKIVEQNRKLKK